MCRFLFFIIVFSLKKNEVYVILLYQGEKTMFIEIYNKIKEFDTIIIHRHKKPDGDALGSQLGLKRAILATFPNKMVLAGGEMGESLSFVGVISSLSLCLKRNLSTIKQIANAAAAQTIATRTSHHLFGNANENPVIFSIKEQVMTMKLFVK